MNATPPAVRRLCISLCLLFFPASGIHAQTIGAQARIRQAIDETDLVAMPGNVHPLARPEFDQGAVSDAAPMNRILLLLQRSPEQDAALQQFMNEQMSKGSANFHNWLTPQQFGQQFGPADGDIRTVLSWLASHGFSNVKVTQGRTIIEFSGTVGQVRNAFHTEIHRFMVNGAEKIANASEPQIPRALAPVVTGIVSLHNFRPRSHAIRAGTFFRSKITGEVKPLYSPPNYSNFFLLGPADFATIYNTAPLLSGKIDGTGQSIAIVGESNINVQDVIDFRNVFGLPQNFSAANIILNGPDPGINSTETESDLDVEWAGAVAPGANIYFVTSAPTDTTSGIHLSAVYAVDNNIAPVMSESFGACEQQLGAAGNQFYNALWQQAAAQGITVILSSGDGGSAGCDNFDTQQTATQGTAVSGFASTPYNVAVGGTDFDQYNNWASYWNTSNTPITQASAKVYIPEIPWNNSCAQIGLSGCGPSAPTGSLNIVAGSGGVSTIYSKPSWQSGPGVPNDHKRDVPDVSLFASNGFTGSAYIICQADAAMIPPPGPSCGLSTLGFTYHAVGGTSAAAPAFAGIMALVNQKQSSTALPGPRQGNANYVLYALAQKPGASCPSSASEAATCIFNDVTKGNSALQTGGSGIGTNSVPCTGLTANCSSTNTATNGVLVVNPQSPTPTEAWTVTPGYDLVTGLGSVNAQNLVNNWGSVAFSPSATALSAKVNGAIVTSISGITHGTAVAITSSVTAASGSGTPSGQVALMTTPNPTANGNPSASLGVEALTLTNGTVTNSSVILPGGQYNLTAHYQGDQTFGPSDSNPPLPVNISAESSQTLISIPIFDPVSGRETGNTPTTLVYGSPYIARFDVANSGGSVTFPPHSLCTPPDCPSGTVTVTDSLNNGAAGPLDAGTFTLNSAGFAEDFAIQLAGGSHVLSASYNGDSSFNKSSGTYAITVTPAATQMLPPNPVLPPTVVAPFDVAGILTMNFLGGAQPSCNFTFYDGPTALPGTPTCNWQANGPFLYASVLVNQATAGGHSYTVKFNGDSNYSPSTSAAMRTQVFYGTTTTASVNPTTVQYGTPVTLTAIVDTSVTKGPAISNAVTFNYFNAPVSGTVSYTPITDSAGNTALQASISFVPQLSSYGYAAFNGDSTYAQSTSPSFFLNVNIPDFTLATNQPSLTITAGTSVTVPITVTPASNASSPVTLSCPPGNYLNQAQVPGITCTLSPATVNLSNGNVATSTLTISTLAPSASPTTNSLPLLSPPRGNPRSFGPMVIISLVAALFLLLCALQVSSKRLALHAAVAYGALLLLGFVGCGGGSSGGGGGGGGGGGAVPTSISLTASSVKVPYNVNFGGTVNLTANISSSKSAGGSVTLTVDGFSGLTQNVSGGVAQFQVTALGAGVHTISAAYSGDANNLPSQTKGSLNVAVTGPTGIVVWAQTGGLTHQLPVNITLQ